MVAAVTAVIRLPRRSQCTARLIRLLTRLGLHIWTGVLTTAVAARQLCARQTPRG